MRLALAHHDQVLRSAIKSNRGTVVKMMGDGMHAAFDDPLDAVSAALWLQQALADEAPGVALRVRCGLHLGAVERREGDLFGRVVNRTARIMGIAHGGQILLSQPVVALVRDRLPPAASLRDLGNVHLRDVATPEQIYQLVHPSLRSEFPALRALAETPNNLPWQATSFVGREREVEQVKHLLAQGRLVTLVGVGGIGKTRLSLELAAEVLDEYPDGIWLVELAPLSDPRLVTQAVASVLGVKEGPGASVVEALLAHLKERRLLILLDNIEHLVEGTAELAHQVLRAAPLVKVLATSREPLRVPGETSFQVPPLGVPDPRETVGLGALAQYESVSLFVTRASAVNASFELKPHNVGFVRNICQRLDGIPLALELAAARVRTLSVEQIDERLVDRFRLLQHGDRTALARQRTLQASIDWSHDLLSEPERIVFRRLAVFAGGWTLQGAEDVTSGSGIDRADVVDILSSLTEKSLVAVDSEGRRYRLLETIRQYAQERLSEAGEDDAVRRRHLDHYLALMSGSDVSEIERLARVDSEFDNLLAGHAWCERAPEGGGLGLRLINHMQNYWIHRGMMELGQRVMAETLARPGAQERNLARSEALSRAGYHCYFMGQAADAEQHLAESISIAREIGDRKQAAWSLYQLAIVHMSRRALATARQHVEESLRLAREIGDVACIARSLETQGLICRAEGDTVSAERLFREALLHVRPSGQQSSVAGILCNLAGCALQRYAGDEARELLSEALAMAEQVQSKWRVNGVLDISSALAALDLDFERAARYYGATETLLHETGLSREPDDELVVAPLIAQARVALGLETFAQLEAQGRALPYADVVSDVRAWANRRR